MTHHLLPITYVLGSIATLCALLNWLGLVSEDHQSRVALGFFNQLGLWYEGTGWTNSGAG